MAIIYIKRPQINCLRESQDVILIIIAIKQGIKKYKVIIHEKWFSSLKCVHYECLISSRSSIVCNSCALPRILKSFKLTRWSKKFLQSFSRTISLPYSRTNVLQASGICKSAMYLRTNEQKKINHDESRLA